MIIPEQANHELTAQRFGEHKRYLIATIIGVIIVVLLMCCVNRVNYRLLLDGQRRTIFGGNLMIVLSCLPDGLFITLTVSKAECSVVT